MRYVVYIISVILGGYLCLFPAAFAEDSDSKEYLLKAAFLYKFIQFTSWPADKSVAQTHSANVCIIGSNPFGAALDVLKKAPQITLNVKTGISESEIPLCNILFISRSEEGRVENILARALGHAVLTVSEIDGFASEGGIIEMVKVTKNIGLFSKDKINLRINAGVAEKEGLHIDAQLLEIAAEVIK